MFFETRKNPPASVPPFYKSGVLYNTDVVQVIWEFLVKRNQRKPFEQNYGPGGKWELLFQNSSEYIATYLLHDSDNPVRYIVVDVWKDLSAFRQFKRQFDKQYRELDLLCEKFTEEETCLGFFTDILDVSQNKPARNK